MAAFVPSKLLDGDAGLLREHAFTRWMSRDLLQASTDFLKRSTLTKSDSIPPSGWPPNHSQLSIKILAAYGVLPAEAQA